MKKLITIAIVLLFAFSAKAQNCPENFDAEKLLEYSTWIDSLRPKLKVVRQWARTNNNAQAELVTNRLEYWAKDISRYIKKYAESHTDAVCKRLTKADFEYLSDFAILTSPLFDIKHQTTQAKFNEIDMTKYK